MANAVYQLSLTFITLLYSVLSYGKNLLETLHKVSVRYDEVE
jgi:hypothetical protein